MCIALKEEKNHLGQVSQQNSFLQSTKYFNRAQGNQDQKLRLKIRNKNKTKESLAGCYFLDKVATCCL